MMRGQQKQSYLFLLERASIDHRRYAAERLRELGMTVIAQFGAAAIEAKATADQVAASRDLGLFAARLKGAMSREHLAELADEQRRVMTLWNTRFTPAYRKLKKDLTHADKRWNAKGLSPPAAAGAIGPEQFLAFVADWERRTGERVADHGGPKPLRRPRPPASPMDSGEFVALERSLAETYDDETAGYHLARLAMLLDPGWRDFLFRLPFGLEELFDKVGGEDPCWEMTGSMAVGLVFIESSQSDGPKFTAAERNQIAQLILDGHSWLTSQHPELNLSWVYDFQYVAINVPNGTGDPPEDYWRNPGMGAVKFDGNSYAGAWSSVAEYREHMRSVNRCDHAFVIFVSPYANSRFAYAADGRITLTNKKDWGGWGRAHLDTVSAHETCHIFGATDEYGGKGTPCSSCSTVHGCDKIPNGNCGACARPLQPCLMDRASDRMCAYTRAHIGWSTLFIETTTGDLPWAGTDDRVWLDIGDRVFELDTSDHDDRERNNVEGYAIWAPELQRADVKRILLRKDPDGLRGGWRLQRVRAWFQGELICEANDIDRWLEDDQRVWAGCRADRAVDIVNQLRVNVTTADVAWAGTDDDVILMLSGREWDLDNPGRNDFERGNRDVFDLDPGTGLYRSAMHSVQIHKSPDGLRGGWKLKGVEIIVDGVTIFNDQSINRWLEDDDRTWSASF